MVRKPLPVLDCLPFSHRCSAVSFRIIEENIRMTDERKKSTDRFGTRKGRKRKELQEAREARMTPRDDRNETEIRNISTRVEGMAHGDGDVRDVDVSASNGNEVIMY